MATLVDSVIIVVKPERLSVKAASINKTTMSLREANVNILRAILNQVKTGQNYSSINEVVS